MPVRKEDEIMAEYLLKGGKMLEKTCKTCGCPLFEVKGKTLCVVCAENAPAASGSAVPAAPVAPAHHGHDAPCSCGEDHEAHYEHGETCGCGEHDTDSCDGGLADELAMTLFSLCERVQNEKDPENVLLLMNAVKAGTESLEILCKL
jgi:UPF0148 protein